MKFIKSIATTLLSLLLLVACNSGSSTVDPGKENTDIYLKLMKNIICFVKRNIKTQIKIHMFLDT